MTVSKTGIRKTERVIEGRGHDVSLHPKGGNFVLLRDGMALYGGERYYRYGYAPQSAVKPEPTPEPERLPLGTRVVIKRGASLSHVWVGQTGTLVERPGTVTAPYDYFAALDSDAEGAFPLALYADEVEAAPAPETEYIFRKGDRVRVIDGSVYGSIPVGSLGTADEDFAADDGFFQVTIDDNPNWWMFGEGEVEPYTEPAPLAVGDRVVYTVPDTFMGEPGSRAATPGLIGELGTVTEAPRNGGVNVRWDNQGTLRNSIEFVQRAPEYREVTYTSALYEGERAVGIQRTSDGQVAGFLAADSPEARVRVAEYMASAMVSGYVYTDTKQNVRPL